MLSYTSEMIVAWIGMIHLLRDDKNIDLGYLEEEEADKEYEKAQKQLLVAWCFAMPIFAVLFHRHISHYRDLKEHKIVVVLKCAVFAAYYFFLILAWFNSIDLFAQVHIQHMLLWTGVLSCFY
jgi:hypothetical protein